MYAQQLADGTGRELIGNIVFSDTVYQTAGSLTDAQRFQFRVYPVLVTAPPPHDSATHIAERNGFTFDEDAWQASIVWNVRPLTAEEIRARIPRVVTMRQGRRALLEFGLLDTVDAALASITDQLERRKAQIDWEYAAEINREDSLVASLSGALGLTDEQLDQLFTLAATF